MRTGFFPRAVKRLRERAIKNVIHQGRFAGTRNSSHHRDHAQREGDIKIFQIIFVRAQDGDARTVRLPPLWPHLDLDPARDIGSGERPRHFHDFLRRSVSYELASVPARPGTKIDHIVRATYGLFIVLNHQHGVAKIAQLFQCLQQPGVVPVMQSDRRLIEHVQNTSQL